MSLRTFPARSSYVEPLIPIVTEKYEIHLSKNGYSSCGTALRPSRRHPSPFVGLMRGGMSDAMFEGDRDSKKTVNQKHGREGIRRRGPCGSGYHMKGRGFCVPRDANGGISGGHGKRDVISS
jgi:hypothetical protein